MRKCFIVLRVGLSDGKGLVSFQGHCLKHGGSLSQAGPASQMLFTEALFSASGNMNLKLGIVVYLHISTYFLIALLFIYRAFPPGPKSFTDIICHTPPKAWLQLVLQVSFILRKQKHSFHKTMGRVNYF